MAQLDVPWRRPGSGEEEERRNGGERAKSGSLSGLARWEEGGVWWGWFLAGGGWWPVGLVEACFEGSGLLESLPLEVEQGWEG